MKKRFKVYYCYEGEWLYDKDMVVGCYDTLRQAKSACIRFEQEEVDEESTNFVIFDFQENNVIYY